MSVNRRDFLSALSAIAAALASGVAPAALCGQAHAGVAEPLEAPPTASELSSAIDELRAAERLAQWAVFRDGILAGIVLPVEISRRQSRSGGFRVTLFWPEMANRRCSPDEMNANRQELNQLLAAGNPILINVFGRWDNPCGVEMVFK